MAHSNFFEIDLILFRLLYTKYDKIIIYNYFTCESNIYNLEKNICNILVHKLFIFEEEEDSIFYGHCPEVLVLNS